MMRQQGQENVKQGIVLSYVESCVSGSLGAPDCGPIWQLGVIAALLLVAVAALVALQFRKPQARRT
jgi:hypothetical protein